MNLLLQHFERKDVIAGASSKAKAVKAVESSPRPNILALGHIEILIRTEYTHRLSLCVYSDL